MTDLNKLAESFKEVSELRNKQNSWDYDTVKYLKHCAGEVVEATEAYEEWTYCKDGTVSSLKEAFASELADIMACVLIVAAKEHINIEEALASCLEKNCKRTENKR